MNTISNIFYPSFSFYYFIQESYFREKHDSFCTWVLQLADINMLIWCLILFWHLLCKIWSFISLGDALLSLVIRETTIDWDLICWLSKLLELRGWDVLLNLLSRTIDFRLIVSRSLRKLGTFRRILCKSF